MDFSDTRIPTHLWVEGKIRELSTQGIGVYVLNKGEKMNGLLLLKLVDGAGLCQLLTQQRNFDGVLEWIDAMNVDRPEERQADEYIQRSITRDPDLWVVEIEGAENPFSE